MLSSARAVRDRIGVTDWVGYCCSRKWKQKCLKHESGTSGGHTPVSRLPGVNRWTDPVGTFPFHAVLPEMGRRPRVSRPDRIGSSPAPRATNSQTPSAPPLGSSLNRTQYMTTATPSPRSTSSASPTLARASSKTHRLQRDKRSSNGSNRPRLRKQPKPPPPTLKDKLRAVTERRYFWPSAVLGLALFGGLLWLVDSGGAEVGGGGARLSWGKGWRHPPGSGTNASYGVGKLTYYLVLQASD